MVILLDKNSFPSVNKMIKIGIYFPGEGLENINMCYPEDGNPGMGGTEYCELILAYNLSLMNSRYDCRIISHVQLNLPSTIPNIVISSFDHLKILDGKLDILILKTPRTKFEYDILNSLVQTKIITWSHNYLNSHITKWISESQAISLNVFVSRQMYDFYLDDNIITKSTSIFNIVYDTLGECIRSPQKNVVTFMGALTKTKGIVELFKIWEIIEREIPDAKLNIIGGGNLYNRNLKIGSLGLTDEATENEILKYIITPDGKIKPSIRFLGILGKEKYEVFLKSSVGIVNPSAKTETFGLGIIEMATAKLPVVTLNWNGHPDTAINNQTALLGNNIKDMASKIILLFNNMNLNMSLGEEGKRQVKRFAPCNIMPQWEEAILNVIHGSKKNKINHFSPPLWNNYKFVRIINSFFRFKLKLKFLPSIIMVETFIYKIIRQVR